jgi:uncharacterized protein
VSNPYGSGGRPQDRPAPPPGVLPPPQPTQWQQGTYAPPRQQYPQQQYAGQQGQYYGPQQGQYQGQWAQPYYGGGPNHFNGFQPPRRKSA